MQISTPLSNMCLKHRSRKLSTVNNISFLLNQFQLWSCFAIKIVDSRGTILVDSANTSDFEHDFFDESEADDVESSDDDVFDPDEEDDDEDDDEDDEDESGHFQPLLGRSA